MVLVVGSRRMAADVGTHDANVLDEVAVPESLLKFTGDPFRKIVYHVLLVILFFVAVGDTSKVNGIGLVSPLIKGDHFNFAIDIVTSETSFVVLMAR